MINQLFAVAMLILGLILMGTNFTIDNALKGDKCDDTQLKQANKGILVMGTIVVVTSLSYLFCQAKCGQGKAVVFETKVYAGFCLVLGIVIVVLASIIQSRAKTVHTCSDAKAQTTIITVLGYVMIVFSTGYFGMEAYQTSKRIIPIIRGGSAFKCSAM